MSKYETHVKNRLIEVEDWARNGLTDEQIAKNLGVAYSTLREYRNKYSALSAAMRKGKNLVDAEVESSFFKMTTGFVKKIKKPIKIKETFYGENGKKIKEEEKIVMVEEEIFVPPNVTAQMFCLRNRRPDNWKEKTAVEYTGEIKTEVQTLTDEELDKQIYLLKTKLGIKNE